MTHQHQNFAALSAPISAHLSSNLSFAVTDAFLFAAPITCRSEITLTQLVLRLRQDLAQLWDHANEAYVETHP